MPLSFTRSLARRSSSETALLGCTTRLPVVPCNLIPTHLCHVSRTDLVASSTLQPTRLVSAMSHILKPFDLFNSLALQWAQRFKDGTRPKLYRRLHGIRICLIHSARVLLYPIRVTTAEPRPRHLYDDLLCPFSTMMVQWFRNQWWRTTKFLHMHLIRSTTICWVENRQMMNISVVLLSFERYECHRGIQDG